MSNKRSSDSDVDSFVDIGEVQGGIRDTVIAGGNVVQRFENIANIDIHNQRHRLFLINQVKNRVERVLDDSLYNEVRLHLGLGWNSEAIIHRPWEMIYQVFDQPERHLTPDITIIDIYQDLEFPLLISGEAGSGKTTMLYEVARATAYFAEENVFEPAPVVLNLSTWVDTKQSFNKWLVAEVASKYKIPAKLGQRWIVNSELLLLLDGLDEVDQIHLVDCVDALNRFIGEHISTRIIVCCRVQDYHTLSSKINFQAAVTIQPLTTEKICDFLREVGAPLEALRTAIESDEVLRDFAKSPLNLNVMSLAYENTARNDLTLGEIKTDIDRRKHMFSAYVERMLNRSRRTPNSTYTNSEQITSYLSWLARQMGQHHQAEFSIESLQPSWLWTSSQFHLYLIYSRILIALAIGVGWSLLLADTTEEFIKSGLIWLMIGSLIAFLDISRFEGVFKENNEWAAFVMGGVTGLIFGLIGGPSSGILGGFTALYFFRATSKRNDLRYISGVAVIGIISLRVFGHGLVDAAFGGLIVSLIYGMQYRSLYPQNDIRYGRILSWTWQGAIKGVLVACGVCIGFSVLWLLRDILKGGIFDWQYSLAMSAILIPCGAILGGFREHQILTRWSWSDAVKGSLFGIVISLIFPVFLILIKGLYSEQTFNIIDYSIDSFMYSLFLITLLGLSGFVLGGFRRSQKNLANPSTKGLLFLFENMVSISLIATLSFGSIFWSLGFLANLHQKGSIPDTQMILLPFSVGIIVALWYGGSDLIKAIILRWMLYSSKRIPLHFTSFLDFAYERILLRKVAGSYVFIHIAFRDHMAQIRTLDEMQSKRFGATQVRLDRITFHDFMTDIAMTKKHVSLRNLWKYLFRLSWRRSCSAFIFGGIILFATLCKWLFEFTAVN